MGRSFTDRVNASKRQQRRQQSTDGARRTEKVPDLASDARSEVSIDERLSQLSRNPSFALSDVDGMSSHSFRLDTPNARSSLLLERERTISALMHKVEEMHNRINSMTAEQDQLREENACLRKENEARRSEDEIPTVDLRGSDANVAVSLQSSPVKASPNNKSTELEHEQPMNRKVSWAKYATTTSLLSCVAVAMSVVAVSSLRGKAITGS